MTSDQQEPLRVEMRTSEGGHPKICVEKTTDTTSPNQDIKLFKKFSMKESVLFAEGAEKYSSLEQVEEEEEENHADVVTYMTVVPISSSKLNQDFEAMKQEILSVIAAERKARTELSKQVDELANELNIVKMERELDAERIGTLESNLLRCESQLHQKRSWHLVNVAPPVIQPVQTILPPVMLSPPRPIQISPPTSIPLPEVIQASDTLDQHHPSNTTPSRSTPDENKDDDNNDDDDDDPSATSKWLSNGVRQLEDELLALCDIFGSILCANLPRQYNYRYHKTLDFRALGFLKMSQMLAKMDRIEVSGGQKAQISRRKKRINTNQQNNNECHHASVSEDSASDVAVEFGASFVDIIHKSNDEDTFQSDEKIFSDGGQTAPIPAGDDDTASDYICNFRADERQQILIDERSSKNEDDEFEFSLSQRVNMLEKIVKRFDIQIEADINKSTFLPMRRTLPF